jgi:predicted ATPase
VSRSKNTPFNAIIEMLARWLELQDAANTEQQFERVEQALASAGLIVTEDTPLIADLLQLPAGDRYPASTLTAGQKRRRVLAALSGWVLGAARMQPLVMVVEDLHWLDPSTLELLQLLAEQGATVPLMLLCTARSELHAAWPMRTPHTQITLNRLSSRNVREMVALVAARNAFAAESVEAVVERTGGVPLFVEELTRAVLEGGNASSSGREIPATLHDSLMARLDRLGPAKEVIQIGAVIGSEISYRLLHAVHPIAGEDLQGAIQSAIDAELVYVRGNPPNASYQFKHALVRDAAYEALLRSRRKELHSRIAETLLKHFPETVTSAPEHLAHHYTQAGLIVQAIPNWQQAGQKAIQRSANVEASSHLSKGLELLKTLPDTPERVQQELTLQLALAAPLMATKGWATPEVARAYSRARELCQRVGQTPQLFPALWRQWGFYFIGGELQTAPGARGAASENSPERTRPRAPSGGPHHALWPALFFHGEFALTRAHLEQGTALYDSPQHGSRAFFYGGHDPGVCCQDFWALTLCSLGYPDQALKKVHEALILAQGLSHPLSLAVPCIMLPGFIRPAGRDRKPKSGQRL